MHRSGTSALSRIINLLGYELTNDLMDSNVHNPLGYWEPRPIVRFNDKLLADFDRSWGDPKPMPEGWAESDIASDRLDQVVELLRAEIDDSRRTVIKDPRLSRLMPMWRRALDQSGTPWPLCLIACRNPLEVIQSLAARDRMSIEHAQQLWLTYLLEVEFETRGLPRVVIHYESLLDDWRATLKDAFAALELPPPEGIDGEGGDVDAYIDHGERHHSATPVALMASADIDDAVKTAYGLVSEDLKLERHHGFDRLRAQWHKRWEETSPGAAASSFGHLVPDWHVARIARLEADGLIDKAIAAAQDAVGLRPPRANLHHRLATLLARADRLAEAEAAERMAIAMGGTLPWNYQRLSLILERLGRGEEAIEAQRQAVQCGAGIAQLHHRLGNLLSRVNRFDEAVAEQRQAIELNADAPYFHNALSSALENLGRTGEAIEAQRQAVKQGADIAVLQYRYGKLLLRQGRFEEAEAAHRKSVELKAENPLFHEVLSDALHCLGRLDEAIAAQQGAVHSGPRTVRLHQRLGVRLSRAGRYREAAEAYDRAVALARSKLFDGALLSSGTPKPAQSLPVRDVYELLGLLGAQRWASDAADLIGRRPETSGDEPLWPLGQAIPQLQAMPRRPATAQDKGPCLSIMLPVHDVKQEDWLNQCLDSVLAQDRGPEWAEIVVVDDASSNSAARTIAQNRGARVTYRCNASNLGLVGNHNECIATARGDLVHILHQDDYVEPGFYDALVEPMVRDPSLVAGYANFHLINRKGEPIGRQPLEIAQAGVLVDWLETLAQGQAIQFAAIIVRRSAYLALGGFSSSSIFAFDWQMWGRLAAMGPVWYEPRPLANFRSHPDSATYGIAPLDRLLDGMRVALGMLMDLPADIREAVARTAFSRIIPRSANSLASNSGAFSPDERRRLTDFLLAAVEDEAERAMLASALKERDKA